MKRIRFHPEADSEMTQAGLWYETQQKDLGKRFLSTVQDAVNRIEINPLIFPAIEGSARRALTKNFPYGVIFRSVSNEIEIVAVMHLHREPNYWHSR